ncbi:unnamed protein product, partial [Effrenium voratum]
RKDASGVQKEEKRGFVHNSKRAVKNWRVVLQQIVDMLVIVARMSAQGALGEESGGVSIGSSSSSTAPAPKELNFGIFYKPKHKPEVASDKQRRYAELIKDAPVLPPRNCKESPKVTSGRCMHSAEMLKGAGNQYSREVWCAGCHQRWQLTKGQMEQTKPVKRSQGKAQPVFEATSEPTVMCHCARPAERLLVKKEGPRQGRAFWKCVQRQCDYFWWEPLKEDPFKRNRQLREFEEMEEERLERVKMGVVQEAERRYQEIIQVQQHQIQGWAQQQAEAHTSQVHALQSQVMFLTAAMGEERMRQVMTDPQARNMAWEQVERLRSHWDQDKEEVENAPWAQKISTPNLQNQWCLMQLEDEEKPNYAKRVKPGCWKWREDVQKYEFHPGILHIGNEEHVYGVFADEMLDPFYEEENVGTLRSKDRKKISRKMNEMVEWNYPRMNPKKAFVMLAEGIEHVEFAMKLFEWQVRRGRLALFEHPTTSKAWHESAVKRVLSLPGVRRVRGDQCMYGLQVGGGSNKKSTDFMVNGDKMEEYLSKRCDGGHQHVPLLHGLARHAQEYPHKLCVAMVKGAFEDKQKNEKAKPTGEDLERSSWVWDEQGWKELESRVFAQENAGEPDLDDEIEAEEQTAEAREGRVTREMPVAGDEEQSHAADDLSGEVPDRGLTERDKKMVKELHSKMGHPANADFSRMLRLARARTPVWRYAQKEFECDICKGQQRPKAARPSVPPACLAPGQVVGVDVVFFPGVNPREAQPVLNIIDWGSCYQMLEPLDSKSSAAAWSAFQRSWMRTFGVPQIIVCDQGREFLGSFAEKLMQMGCAHKTIGARAPWQQGRTERHGGLAKLVFLKLREEDPPSNLEEWKACIFAVEAAKNRMYHKSGFSPAQRQLGENVRLPGTLGSDDVYDPALLVAGAGEQVRRILEMRRKAMEAFVRCSAEEAISRASKARPRVVREFLAGDLVYVYRTPLPRKRNRDEEERPEARELRRPVWVGPGVVVSKEGPNVWIAMRGELWKCACEQVRLATNVEHEAHGMLRDEFEELRIEMMRKSSKRAFKDISKWEHPPEGDEELAEGERFEQFYFVHYVIIIKLIFYAWRGVGGVAGGGNYGPIRPRLQRYHDEPYSTGLWCVTEDLKEVEEQHTTVMEISGGYTDFYVQGKDDELLYLVKKGRRGGAYEEIEIQICYCWIDMLP